MFVRQEGGKLAYLVTMKYSSGRMNYTGGINAYFFPLDYQFSDQDTDVLDTSNDIQLAE